MRRLLSASLAVLSLLLLGYLAREHLGELGRLGDVSLIRVAAIIALFLLARVANAQTIRVGLDEQGHRIGLGESFMLAIVGNYTNLLVPRTGLAPPAVYLKARHQVAYEGYLSIAIVSLLLSTVISALLALGLYLALQRGAGLEMHPELALALFGFALAAVLLLLAPGRLFGLLPERLARPLEDARASWLQVAGQPSTMVRIIGLQALAIGLRALRLYLVLGAAGLPVDLAASTLVSCLADLGTLISLTPAALGFREGALLYGASALGLDPALALVAAVIDRLACTFAVVVLGQLFLWRGLRDLERSEPGSEPS